MFSVNNLAKKSGSFVLAKSKCRERYKSLWSKLEHNPWLEEIARECQISHLHGRTLSEQSKRGAGNVFRKYMLCPSKNCFKAMCITKILTNLKSKQTQKCQKCFDEAEGPTLVKISRKKFVIEWGNVGHGMMESASYRSLGRAEREKTLLMGQKLQRQTCF